MRADQAIPREVCVGAEPRRAASRAVVLGACGDGENPSHGVEFPVGNERKRD